MIEDLYFWKEHLSEFSGNVLFLFLLVEFVLNCFPMNFSEPFQQFSCPFLPDFKISVSVSNFKSFLFWWLKFAHFCSCWSNQELLHEKG